MGLRHEWPNLGVISFAHSYGFSNLVLPLLLDGIPLILAASHLPDSLRAARAQFRDITLAGVPVLWRAWFEAGVVSDSIRLAISAGAPLPLDLETKIYSQTGVKVHNFYGSTECGGIAFDLSKGPRHCPSEVGEPLQNVELAVNSEGCLEVRGPAVGLTYWPQYEDSLCSGRFRTADLAEIINGKVHLYSRKSDLINIAGRKVSPESIEQILMTHPSVRDAVVFGVPCSRQDRSETIVACVSTQRQIDARNLTSFLGEKLPPWQVPKIWQFVGLETNSRGKRSRSEWRRRFLEGAQSHFR